MNLNENNMQKASLVAGLAILANLLWGSAAPIIKTGYRLLQVAPDDTASQILFAGARFFTAGILAIILGSIINGHLLKPTKTALPKIAWLAVFQTIIQYVFFYIGCANTSGVKVSIVLSTSTFISILISSLIFSLEKLNAKKILGCALGFVGVVLVNLGSEGSMDFNLSFRGEGFILISTVSFAFSNALSKMFSKTENPVMLCGWQFVLGGAIMSAAGLALGGRLFISDMTGPLIILYLAMVSAVAFSITSLLMKYNPVSRVSIFSFFNPIFGVMLSMLILGESGRDFGPRGVLALLLVCLGVLVVNYSKTNSAD